MANVIFATKNNVLPDETTARFFVVVAQHDGLVRPWIGSHSVEQIYGRFGVSLVPTTLHDFAQKHMETEEARIKLVKACLDRGAPSPFSTAFEVVIKNQVEAQLLINDKRPPLQEVLHYIETYETIVVVPNAPNAVAGMIRVLTDNPPPLVSAKDLVRGLMEASAAELFPDGMPQRINHAGPFLN